LLADGALSLAERMATPRGVGPEVTARLRPL
jgi:hypothetical protein